MALDAVIFDFDGTLLDTNATHVRAWREAFARYGYKVPEDRIFEEIGKGGDTLVPDLLGREADEKDGKGLRKAQPEEFTKLAQESGLKAFPGAAELIEGVKRLGLKTILATSSSGKQLQTSEKYSGFPVSKLVDQIVNADDAQTSKPAPDLIKAAVQKLGMSPAQCMMLGDTAFDAISAKNAGVITLCLTCGGRPAEELRRGGARAIYRDPQDLLTHLEDALHIASPGSAHLTQEVLERLMREALQVAREGMAAGEVPIGAVIARGDASVVARGYNELNRTGNKTAHAEMVTFAHAAGTVPMDDRDLILVSTLEPCVMCLGAAMEASVDTVIFGLKAPADNGTQRVEPPESPESGMPRIVGGILPDASRELFGEWLQKPSNNPQQVSFVKQLLALTDE